MFPVWLMVVTGSLIATVAVWFGAYQYVSNKEFEAISREAEANVNLARAFKDRALSVIADVDAHSKLLAAQLQTKGVAKIDLRSYKDTITPDPHVARISTFDASGLITASSLPQMKKGSRSDREYFAVHTNANSEDLFIGTPIVSRTTNEWLIPLTRRLNTSNGAFAGVLLIALDARRFADYFSGLALGNGIVMIVRDDGVVILRRSKTDLKFAMNISNTAAFQRAREMKTGYFISAGTVDATPRIIATEAIGNYPISMRVATSLDEALAGVRKDRILYFSVATSITVLLWAGALLVTALFSRQRRVNRELSSAKDQSDRLLQENQRALSERQRADSRTASLLKISQIDRSLTENDVLRIGMEEIEALTGSKIAFLHLVNEDQRSVDLLMWSSRTLAQCGAAFNTHYPISSSGIWADCVQSKQASVVNDYPNCTSRRSLPNGHVPLQRLISVPVIEGDQVRIIVGVGNKASDYDQFDVETVNLVGSDIWRIARGLRSEAALLRSESLLNRTQNISKIGGWEYEVASGASYWTEEVYRIHEIDRDCDPNDFVEAMQYYASEDRAAIERAFRRAVDLGEPYDLELRLVGARGTQKWVRTMAQTEKVAGKIVRVFGNICDITEQKQMSERLRASEAQYRSLFESAPVPIWEEDFSAVHARLQELATAHGSDLRTYLNGCPAETMNLARLVRIVNMNQASVRFFGASGTDEMMTSLSRYFDAESLVVFAEELAVLATGANHFEAEVPIRDLQGERRNVMLYLDICPGYEQSWNKVYVSFTDITELRRLEEMHVNAQKLQSLGTLAGGIAHDFNNILTAIRGNAELAAADVDADHPAAVSLSEIRKAGLRASELVRRIMAFGRPQPPRREAVDLAEVVQEVLTLLRSTVPAGIAFNTNFERDLPRVFADSAQVHEAVVNLTTNAAYAIGPRAGMVDYALASIEVAPGQAAGLGLVAGQFVRMSVKDSGCGMDESTMPRIFDAFFTTKPMGEGSGLGLSMVYGIMRSHGGAILAESAFGKGSSFHLYFPVATEIRGIEGRSEASSTEHAPGRRVMYVDDEEALVFLATRALERHGHKVSGFLDPVAALERFRAQPGEFDVVVTDLSMPHMSGFELARSLLAIRADMPVLMTSGYIKTEDELQSRAIGIRELILKPNTMDDLVEVLNQLFRTVDVGPSCH